MSSLKTLRLKRKFNPRAQSITLFCNRRVSLLPRKENSNKQAEYTSLFLFLAHAIEEPMSKGSLLDLIFTNKEELVGI